MSVYFVSGVCGVGKSAVIPHLRSLLPANRYIVQDFDTRGVPDGADRMWRKEETSFWLQEASRAASEGKEMVICGFVKPEDFDELSNVPQVRVIVLDADEETIRERLIRRYTKAGIFDESQTVIGKPVTEFIAGNVWYSRKMREESATAGLPVIDTSDLTPEQVSQQIARIIQA